jgi:Ca2+-binding RTX toxin-like protein
MHGNAGNDTYTVDNAGDTVNEKAGEGTDKVETTLAKYKLGTNVENLKGLAPTTQSLTGNGGANIIQGGIADDLLVGNAGNDVLKGGKGNDDLIGGAGDDTLDGQSGLDTAKFVGTADVAIDLNLTTAQATGAGNDRLVRIENLVTGSGRDQLTGNASANAFKAGGGDDILIGNAGKDVLMGKTGEDRLSGGDDADDLRGGGGRDILIGGQGNDLLNGQNGTDTADYSGTVNVTVNLSKTTAQNTGHGRDTLTKIENLISGSGDDKLIGNAGNNELRGGTGDDLLKGEGGKDVLFGGGGNDTLRGGDAVDTLVGGNGMDVLYGDAAGDTLTGGGGKDRFVFNNGFSRDRITDFEIGTDVIDLTSYSGVSQFSDLSIGKNSAGDALVSVVGTDAIVLEGIAKADVEEGDFLF